MGLNPALKKGCGIGCGVMVFATLLVIGGGVWFVRGMGSDFKMVRRTEAELVAAAGDAAAFAPASDGLPTAEQLAAFVVVREATAEWRLLLETRIESFLEQEGRREGGLRHTVRMLQAGGDLAPAYAGFWSARNRALLEQGLGLGEYVHLYCLVYYGGLGHDPADGVVATGRIIRPTDTSGFQVQVGTPGEREAPRDEQALADRARRQVRGLMLEQIERALATAPAEADTGALAAEAARLRGDPLRVPWREQAPAQLAERLGPLAAVLEANYLPLVNPVELIFEAQQMGWNERE